MVVDVLYHFQQYFSNHGYIVCPSITASDYPFGTYNFSKFIIAFYNVMQKKKLSTIFLYPLNQRLISEISIIIQRHCFMVIFLVLDGTGAVVVMITW
jgi:hypothetical protein